MAIREKVLIIGNGFDLYHELPTKYSQFIKVLMNIEALNIVETKEITFEDLFKDVERSLEIKVRFDTEKMIFEKNKIIEIKNSLNQNLWYKSFKTKLNYENWIDVEDEIKETLKLFQSLSSKLNKLFTEVKLVEQITINENGFNSQTRIDLNQKEINYCNAFNLSIKNGRLTILDKKNLAQLITH